LTVLTPLKTTGKQEKRVRQGLDKEYAYLAGNAMGKDKKGRPTKDDSELQGDMQAAGQGGGDSSEYSPYVCYDLEVE
jgi:V-type H+-transporting ATPase subunit C